MPTDPMMLQYANSAAPNNPPDGQLAIAGQSTDANSAIDNAQALAAYGDATTQVNRLQSLSADEQRQYWNNATADQQALWSGANYKVPKQHRGLLSRVAHDVIGAPAALYRDAQKVPYLGDAMKATNRVAGEVGGVALDALGAGSEFAKHAYRAGELSNEVSGRGHDPFSNAFVGIGETGAAGLSHFHLVGNEQWADAWHNSTHGDSTFDPNAVRDIQNATGYDDIMMSLAKAVAAGDTDTKTFLSDQLKAGMSTDQVADLVDKTSNPKNPEYQKFHDAVGNLKDAKLSFGRSLVPQWMWDHAHPMATILSGGGDALFSFVDPTIIGSKINKVVKISKYGFKTVEELNAALKTKGAVKYQEDVAGYLARKDYNGLLDRHPQLAPVVSHLAQSDVTTAEGLAAKMAPGSTAEVKAAHAAQQEADNALNSANNVVPELGKTDLNPEQLAAVKDALQKSGLAQATTQQAVQDWMQGNMLALHIFSGGGTAISHGTNLVPALTPVGKAFLDSKGSLKKSIDWLRTEHFDVGPDGAKSILGQTLSGPMQFVGNTAKKLTTLIPQGVAFNPEDPKAIIVIQRFANQYLPPAAVAHLVNMWAVAPNNGAKRGVYAEMLDQTFKAMGIEKSDDSQLAAYFTSVIGKNGVQQKYAANGIDEMLNDGGNVSAHGLLEKHMAEQWALPSFRDLSANVNRSGFNKLVYGVTNNPLANGFSMIWKPAQLLRLGFPVRVTIEEMAGGIARNGPLDMAKAALAGKAMEGNRVTKLVVNEKGKLKRVVQDSTGFGMTGPLADLNPIEAGFSRMMRSIPEKWRPEVDTINKLQSMVLANRTQRALRFVAGKVPGVGDLIETAMKYAEIFEKSLSGDISSVETQSLGMANDAQKATEVLKGGMQKTPLNITPRVRVKDGKYIQYEPGQEGYFSAWMKNLDDIAGSGAARHVLQHLLNGSDVNTLRESTADHLQSPGFRKWWKASVRSSKTADNRTVGRSATEREAALDWADKLIQHVESLVPGATDMPGRMSTMERNLAQGVEAQHQARIAQLTRVTSSLEGLARWHSKPADAVGLTKAQHLANVSNKAFKNLPQDVKGFLNVHGSDVNSIERHYNDLEEAGHNLKSVQDDLAGDAARSHRETMIQGLLNDGKSPDLHKLWRLPKEHLPDAVKGPEYLNLPLGGVDGLLSEFVEKGFHRIGHAIDAWSRQPLYLHAVHKADKDLAPLVNELFGETPMGDEILHTLVRQRADRETLQFVHDPKVRSQMNILTQNLAPFQFAQEQFWKRWGKTFIHSPEAMREAELAHHALGATGFTHTDDTGTEIFTYPASGFAQKAITEGLDAMGIPAALPVKQVFTGQLKMVAPGLDRSFAPSFGPLVSVPLTLLTRQFHELEPIQHAALGDIGTGRPLWEQVAPSSVSRLVNATIANDAISPAYANAQMRAIQDLYASKHGLDPNASPHDRQLFMDRVKQWTRINMFLRAGLGFGAPAAPSSAIGDTKIAHELRVLSESGMNFTDAMRALVQRNPDAFPYTVFESVGAGSETLPATKAAADMFAAHPEFFRDFPDAAGFLLPTKSSNDKFNSEAYKDQLLNHMRIRRSPKEFLDQIMYSQAAGDYYDTRDAYQLQTQHLHGQALAEAANRFQTWKAQYLKEHPVFADKLTMPSGPTERLRTTENLKKALNSPNVPQGDQTNQIRDLVDTYGAYQANYAKYAGMNSTASANARKQMKVQFAGWAKSWVRDNPGALDVYNRLIRPDVDPTGSGVNPPSTGTA